MALRAIDAKTGKVVCPALEVDDHGAKTVAEFYKSSGPYICIECLNPFGWTLEQIIAMPLESRTEKANLTFVKGSTHLPKNPDQEGETSWQSPYFRHDERTFIDPETGEERPRPCAEEWFNVLTEVDSRVARDGKWMFPDEEDILGDGENFERDEKNFVRLSRNELRDVAILPQPVPSYIVLSKPANEFHSPQEAIERGNVLAIIDVIVSPKQVSPSQFNDRYQQLKAICKQDVFVVFAEGKLKGLECIRHDLHEIEQPCYKVRMPKSDGGIENRGVFTEPPPMMANGMENQSSLRYPPCVVSLFYTAIRAGMSADEATWWAKQAASKYRRGADFERLKKNMQLRWKTPQKQERSEEERRLRELGLTGQDFGNAIWEWEEMQEWKDKKIDF